MHLCAFDELETCSVCSSDIKYTLQLKYFKNFPGAKHNFNKYGRQTIDSLGTKYDYGSVMHYGSKAFSKNKQPTIVAKQTGVSHHFHFCLFYC